jgi:prephenate dehydrogenase
VHLAFLGLGLIGGSIARAASRSGFATRMTAWTPSGAGPAAAVADGIEAADTPAAALRDADLVILAAPPLACLDLLDDLAGPLRGELAPDAVITDVASTKVQIVARARRHGLRFVGGHPMAGRETTGYGAGDADLVRDRPWVIVPAEPADPDADQRVAELARACGARSIRMTAEDHDSAVAGISHLPLVVSAVLAETVTKGPDWGAASALRASGWAGMTRLAQGDPDMGAGILATNAPAVLSRLHAFRATLDGWIAAIDEASAEARTPAGRIASGRSGQAALEQRLAATRRVLSDTTDGRS